MRPNRAKKYNNLIESKLVENMSGPLLPTWAHQLIALGLINGHFYWTHLTGPFSLICSSWTVAVVNILSSPSRHWIDVLSIKKYVGYEQKRHICTIYRGSIVFVLLHDGVMNTSAQLVSHTVWIQEQIHWSPKVKNKSKQNKHFY